MIVGISGLAGTGKDTVADLLVEKHGFVKVGLADPLKRICKEVFDFSDEQLWGPSEKRNAPDARYRYTTIVDGEGRQLSPEEVTEVGCADRIRYLTPRHALQQLGSEWGRGCYQDVWVDLALRTAKAVLEGVPVRVPYVYPPGHDGPRETYVELQPCGYDAKAGLGPPSRTPPAYRPRGVVIPDVRFKNEMTAIRKAGGKLVRVLRPETGLSGVAGLHVSEREQLEIPDEAFDHVLFNGSSLENLRLHVASLMDRLTGRIRPYDEVQADVPPWKRVM